MGDKEREALHKKFENMMSALYKQEGANLDIPYFRNSIKSEKFKVPE